MHEPCGVRVFPRVHLDSYSESLQMHRSLTFIAGQTRRRHACEIEVRWKTFDGTALQLLHALKKTGTLVRLAPLPWNFIWKRWTKEYRNTSRYENGRKKGLIILELLRSLTSAELQLCNSVSFPFDPVYFHEFSTYTCNTPKG